MTTIKAMRGFLKNLSENNSLEWMHQHEKEKKAALTDFYSFVQTLQNELIIFDSEIPLIEPNKLSFRLNRDTRFSHDKSPYNPTFRAHIGPNGKPFIPAGYFIQLAPEGHDSFLGGGVFGTQFPQATAMVRDYLLEHPKEFLALLEAPDFKKYFQLRGECLKRFPKGYEETGTAIDEFLKYKSWYLQYDLNEEQLQDEKALISTCLEIFKAMKPFNDYLNRALVDFQFPERR
ncbi:DUF2461 domain-containing protein [Enterococcus sp. BWR-S5]|uniref:DUF2461 domain-containing protein n=1 Tax=Enterococcus sp. BWR-S5 TaxID=2787714 RepID=UPI001F22E3EE|nr:DUF2461 domain-containing protein [Enterococcus sp. BWR-S5]